MRQKAGVGLRGGVYLILPQSVVPRGNTSGGASCPRAHWDSGLTVLGSLIPRWSCRRGCPPQSSPHSSREYLTPRIFRKELFIVVLTLFYRWENQESSAFPKVESGAVEIQDKN